MANKIYCNECARDHDFDLEETYDFNLHLVLPINDPRNEIVWKTLDDTSIVMQALGFNSEYTNADRVLQ